MKYELVENGTKLCVIVDVTPAALAKATQSKSAIAKALAKGGKAEDVPATLLATTGGFVSVGPVKLSLNVLRA